MLNDSYWKEYNGGERALLQDADGNTIAYIQKKDYVWDCKVYPELIKENFYFGGIHSIEEVEWQVTLYIEDKCRNVMNNVCKIRDHLPSIHELAERARNKNG